MTSIRNIFGHEPDFLPRLLSVEKIRSIAPASIGQLKFGSWHEGYRYVFGPLRVSKKVISPFPIFNPQYLVGGKPSLVVICSCTCIEPCESVRESLKEIRKMVNQC